ncbi:MAG: DUF4269 domain-containing protein [Aeromonas sp.]
MLSDLCVIPDELTAAPAAVFPSRVGPAQPNWRRLDYLMYGNARQRSAHALLSAGLWDALQQHCSDVALVSTVAIGLDRPQSDLDIICQHPAPAQFAAIFAAQGWQAKDKGEQVWLLAGPDGYAWPVELYVTPVKLETLNSWRHLTLMAALLAHFDHHFYQAVRWLRSEQGVKGEAAMCHLLGLKGDPYRALLALEGQDLEGLRWQMTALSPELATTENRNSLS